MFRSHAMPVALALGLLAAPPATAQDPGSLSLDLPLFASKDKKGTISYKPLKVSKGGATVTVRFYDGPPDGSAPIHESEVVITAKAPDAPFAAGDQPQSDKVSGMAHLVISDLPADLLTKDVWVTTQVSVAKGKKVLDYAESPARPLGLSGITEGRDLNPRSITLTDADGLMFANGASAGAVLTSDANGQASWQQLMTDGVADGAVTSDKIAFRTILGVDIAEGAIGHVELATNSVRAEEIQDGSVTGPKLAPDAVDSGKIADRSITFIDIAEGAVGQFELGADSVATAELTDLAVTNAKLAFNAVDGTKILDGSISSQDLGTDSVGASEIAANAVGSSEVADNSLTANDLASGSVGYSELQFDCITASLIDPSPVHWGFNVGSGYSNVDYRFEAVEQGSNPHGLMIEHSPSYSGSFVLSTFESNGDHNFWVDSNGNVFADGAFSGGQGFAQLIESTEDQHVLGDVLVIDPSNPRAVRRAQGARSTLVAGVYAEHAGFLASSREFDRVVETGEPAYDADGVPASRRSEPLSLQDMRDLYGEVPVATSGIVEVRVSAENGAILPGDLLVTAWTPGHAMRDPSPAVGTVLGKALGELHVGTGIMQVLITLD
ncbi:MAG: hypothetical protein H6825_00345 [Planctomycetes bacterium]|nr:hypothetical protein [Planctomycetota bacterium]